MPNKQLLQALDKEELIDLITLYAKNWLAMDGVWFQSIERKYGMEEAMYHDAEAWRTFTVIEARRIKQFLQLPARAGLDGLAKALSYRFYANINQDEISIEGNTLIYKTRTCRVQNARSRKGMPLHPCKSVGIIEYTGFAHEIDDRISCECLSCFPDVRDTTCACAWKFTLEE